MHSQRMASIAPIVIECIDYLAYITFFTRAMFCLFPTRKAADERWEVVGLVNVFTMVLPLVHWCGMVQAWVGNFVTPLKRR